MNQRKLSVQLLVGAVMAVSAQAAFFPNSPTVTDELILNFRGYGSNPGKSFNLGVDIGPVSNYNNPNGATFTVPGITAAELKVLYGSSLTELKFSVEAYSKGSLSSGNTLYVTNPANQPWNRQNKAAENTTSASVVSIIGGYVNSGTALAGFPNAKTIDDASGVSYHHYVGQGDFGNWQGSVEADTGTSFSQALSLNFYKVVPDNASTTPPLKAELLGQFRLSPNGNFVYDPTPVPEASSIAFGVTLGGLAIGLALRRRANKA